MPRSTHLRPSFSVAIAFICQFASGLKSLTITATDRIPERAAAIANAFARAISSNLRASASSQIDSAIKGVREQLKALQPGNPDKASLQQQLNQLIASCSTQGGEAATLRAATPSSTPSGTSPWRAVEHALLIGVLLGIGAVLLAESASWRLRTPEDLERMTDLPLPRSS